MEGSILTLPYRVWCVLKVWLELSQWFWPSLPTPTTAAGVAPGPWCTQQTWPQALPSTNEFSFYHPAWSGELSDVALGGNRDLVKNLEVHHLKHSLEWNLFKKYLKITNLHWDEIDNLMIGVSEPEKSLALGSELVIDIEEYQCNWGDEVCFYNYFHISENWRLRWQ